MPGSQSSRANRILLLFLTGMLVLSSIPLVHAAAPVASFSYFPAAPSTAGTVYFNSTSTDDFGNITNYTWDMGDGTLLYGAEVTHQYADNGTYAVVLNITDNETFYDTYSELVTVANVGPMAAFSYDPAAPSTADTVTFTDNSTDNDGTITNWTWDFGDGSPSVYTTNATHIFAAPGDYVVNLTITDNDGATTRANLTMTISAALVGGGGGGPAAGFPGIPFQVYPDGRGEWQTSAYIHPGAADIAVFFHGEGAPVTKLNLHADGEGMLQIVLRELDQGRGPQDAGGHNLLDTFDLVVDPAPGLEYTIGVLELRTDDFPPGVEVHQLMALHGQGGSWVPIPSSPATAEDGTLRLQALTTGFSPFAIAIDDQPPVLQVAERLDPLAVGERLAFSADDNRGIKKVSLTIDGQAVALEHADGVYSYILPAGIPPGTYVARATVEDLSRLTATTAWSFTVAGTPPVGSPEETTPPTEPSSPRPIQAGESPPLSAFLTAFAMIALAWVVIRRI